MTQNAESCEPAPEFSALERELDDARRKASDSFSEVLTLMRQMAAMQGTKQVIYSSYPAANSAA